MWQATCGLSSRKCKVCTPAEIFVQNPGNAFKPVLGDIFQSELALVFGDTNASLRVSLSLKQGVAKALTVCESSV